MNTTGAMTTSSSTGMMMSSSSTGMTCGNDEVDAGEECDGTDLDGETCASQGFLSGTLDCASDCTFDTSGCANEMCGNDAVEGMEVCDGTDLDGESCTTQGFDAGTLGCNGTCSGFDTSACVMFTCGDGMINLMEQCDGADLGGATCASQGFDGGTLACTGTCTFNTAGCLNENCYDLADNDGDALIDCADTGSCQQECDDACFAPPTILDPSVTTGNTTGHADDYASACANTSGPEVIYQVVASQTGFMHLTLNSTVDLGVSAWTGCASSGTENECEDAIVSGNETISVPVTTGETVHVMVDAYNNGVTGAYTLTVASIAAPVCGDGFADGAEACDDGNATNGDGCDTNCTVSACGNGICGGTETPCSCTADCPNNPNACEACECGSDGTPGPTANCYCDAVCILAGDCCANETATCGSQNQPLQLNQGNDAGPVDGNYAGTLATMACASLPTNAIGTVASIDSVVLALGTTWAGDVTIKMVSPAGTVITLLNRPGSNAADTGVDTPVGNGDDLLQANPITFSAGAAVSAENMGVAAGTAICAPAPTGDGICSYAPAADTAPAGNFSNFVGQPVNGTWQICVGDSFTGDVTTLFNTTINMTISG